MPDAGKNSGPATHAGLRKKMEADFHDALRETRSEQVWTLENDAAFEADSQWANMKYYAVERRNRDYVSVWLREHCRGAAVLDYCCGNGLDAVRIAREMNPSSVTGVDISSVSIEHSRQRAADAGVGHIATFHVMDAENLDFPDATFDVVHVYGVLHHLDLPAAYAEIARVLKPGGRAIATEALRHNPIIQWYRRATPQLRTAWEVNHILGRADIELAERYFMRVEARLFNLATLVAVPLRRWRAFRQVLRVLESVDALLLRVPLLKWWAWMAVFTMERPRREGADA